jgi:uncharacterized membrane protein YdjX (TVP38/TMEM64 family)
LKFLPLLFIIIAAAALLPVFSGLQVSDILEYSPEPLTAAAVLLGLYLLKTVAMFIPLLVLFISAGVMFPIGWAFAVTCLGLLCEMTVGYFIGRHLGIDSVLKKMERNGKVRKFLSNQRTAAPTVCFFASFLPFPIEILNMFLGAAKVNYFKFVAFMFLGLTPLMLPGVFLGNNIMNPFSVEFLLPFGAGVALNAAVYAVYRNRKPS